MKLFLAIAWGNWAAGVDGENTAFIVRAGDYGSALKIAEEALHLSRISNHAIILNFISEIGIDASGASDARLILGPCVGGTQRTDSQREWVRMYSDSEWQDAAAVFNNDQH